MVSKVLKYGYAWCSTMYGVYIYIDLTVIYPAFTTRYEKYISLDLGIWHLSIHIHPQVFYRQSTPPWKKTIYTTSDTLSSLNFYCGLKIHEYISTTKRLTYYYCISNCWPITNVHHINQASVSHTYTPGPSYEFHPRTSTTSSATRGG